MLGAGVVGAGAVVAWKVFGDSEESFATPPERQRAWTYAMDGAAAGVSRLTVSGGSLYVTARGPLSVHAVSTESGRKRWVAEVTGGKQGDATLGPVTVVSTTVYAVAEGGHVNAFADADGSRRWASEPLGGGPCGGPGGHRLDGLRTDAGGDDGGRGRAAPAPWSRACCADWTRTAGA